MPQGSNLGSILCAIYVNDIFNNFKSEPVLYVDDMCLTIHVHTVEEQTSSMNQEVEVARQWMQANKLTINATKSTVMVISPMKTSAILDTNLSCVGCPNASKSSVRYLGVALDNKFTFNNHKKHSAQSCLRSRSYCKTKIVYPPKKFF